MGTHWPEDDFTENTGSFGPDGYPSLANNDTIALDGHKTGFSGDFANGTLRSLSRHWRVLLNFTFKITPSADH